jgi:hypothetical protein
MAAQTLAQILSECRKFGLHLTLAHQTLAQLNERMKGALANIQLKIAFGISRPDAEVLASHLFQADGERVKHIVQDVDQRDRSHPVFYSLQEEWERCIQILQNLPSRTAFVCSSRRPAGAKLRTATIRHLECDVEAEVVKRVLSQRTGINAGALRESIDIRPAYLADTVVSRPRIREKAAPKWRSYLQPE